MAIEEIKSILDRERAQLLETILERQKTVYQVMQGGVSPEWLEIDLTMPQLKIMFLLNAHGRLRMGELAEVLGKNLSTTTGVVDKLVEHGLVIREEHPDDRRVVIARITAQGQKLCDSLLRIGYENTMQVLNKLNLEELKVVSEGMEIYWKAAQVVAYEKRSHLEKA